MRFFKLASEPQSAAPSETLNALVQGCSIEVTPRTALKIADFRTILPTGTRVYVAHVEGTPIEKMVATARRLASEGFPVMPHFPARALPNRATFSDWLDRYQGEAGVRQALVLGGGHRAPAGDFDSAIQLLETGLFEERGFTHIHVAGHPEGNPDADRDGTTRMSDEALLWKQGYASRTNAEMAIVTQFLFDADAIARWDRRMREAGVTLPVHLGIAGPARLQNLIKFAIACGVGPSLKVLQKRALDLGKLLLPHEPDDLLEQIAAHVARTPETLIRHVHLFPLGGIEAAAKWMARHRSSQPAVALVQEG